MIGYVVSKYLSSTSASKVIKLNAGFYSTNAFDSATESKPLQAQSDEPISIENPFKKDRAQCILCRLNLEPNYKNIRLLSQFQSSYTGRIYGRHITGLCKSQQEIVEREIKRAQDSGYMPVYHKSPEFLLDPKLFDPERPIRPHKY